MRGKKKKQVQANNYINLYFGNAAQEFLSISNVLRKQLIWNGEVPREIEKRKVAGLKVQQNHRGL